MKPRLIVLLVLVATLPCFACVFQCFWLAKVILPGWGPHLEHSWSQPSSVARLGFSDDAVWYLPIFLAIAIALTGLIVLVASVVKKNAPFAIAGILCMLAAPVLWFHYVIASF